jgi:cbb3-type cytochrome oxidase maturation protein
MFSSTITLIILSIFIGTAAWLVFIWAVKKGQFDDIEGPKYRMLEDDPELPDDTGDSEKDDD